MEKIDMNLVPSFAMSPGLDGWRQEQRTMAITSQVNSTNPHRSESSNLNVTNGDIDGHEVVGKKETLRRSDAVNRLDQSVPVAVSNKRSIRAFKFALVEHIKEELKPYYIKGKINRFVHKIIIKKSISKIIESCGTSGIPENDGAVAAYLRSSQAKISKLIQAYIVKYQKHSS